MRKCDVEKIAKKVQQKLEELGESERKHPGDYYSSFWKEILDAIFDNCRTGTFDRKTLGNAVIQEINSRIGERKKELARTKENESDIQLDMEKLKKDAEKSLPSEIDDVSEEKLWEISGGEYGPKPKPFKKCFGSSEDQSQKENDTWPLFGKEGEKKKNETEFFSRNFR